MAALCALCLAPLTRPFVVSGTEVFHSQCAKVHGTAGSRGNTNRQAVAALRGKVVALELEVQRVQQRADDKEAAAARELERAKHMIRDHERMLERLTESTQLTEDYRRQRDQARRERDEAVAARDAARRELALMQQLGHQPADPPKTEETGKEEPRERFRLLELD